MRRLRIALALVALAAPAAAEDGKPATFTQAQADQGADIYRDHCALCHAAVGPDQIGHHRGIVVVAEHAGLTGGHGR